MMEVELHISALNTSTTSQGNFVMLLQDVEGSRKLPILIGLQEAQSIAVALEQMQPLRPLTHDLFLRTLESLHASLVCVRITDVQNNIFMAVLVIKNAQLEFIEIDSRCSDAIALAIRQQCPILIPEVLLNERAVLESGQGKIFSEKRGQLEQYSLLELYDMLDNLLKKEDYESATIVRDIIAKKTP